jgi:hypothetical protein
MFLLMACDSSSGPTTVVEKSQEVEESVVIKSDRFWADPAVIRSCEENEITTLYWNIPGEMTVEVRVGTPDGALFAVAQGEGSKETDRWVKNGMKFFLVDAATREVIAEANALIDRSGCD